MIIKMEKISKNQKIKIICHICGKKLEKGNYTPGLLSGISWHNVRIGKSKMSKYLNDFLSGMRTRNYFKICNDCLIEASLVSCENNIEELNKRAMKILNEKICEELKK